MPIQVIEYYEISDVYSEDGRGPSRVIARITDYSEALNYARGRGNYDGNANVSPAKMIIADTAADMEEYGVEEKRQSALAKLTETEKELLGLK